LQAHSIKKLKINMMNHLTGAETIFKSWQLLSQSNSLPFMEFEGSMPHSQQPATRHYPVPDKSSPHPHTLF